MPGCGKSIVGRILAERLGMHFIDTDEEIVKKEGCTITDIFSKVGECGFRNIESEIISEVSALQSSVISTGGGAVLRDINIELLRENGMIYFIDRDLNKLAVTSDRPLSSNITDLKKRYDERYDIYCRSADKIIKSENSAVDNANIIEKDFLYEYTCY